MGRVFILRELRLSRKESCSRSFGFFKNQLCYIVIPTVGCRNAFGLSTADNSLMSGHMIFASWTLPRAGAMGSASWKISLCRLWEGINGSRERDRERGGFKTLLERNASENASRRLLLICAAAVCWMVGILMIKSRIAPRNWVYKRSTSSVPTNILSLLPRVRGLKGVRGGYEPQIK